MADTTLAGSRLPSGFDEAFDALFRKAFVVARRILTADAAAEDVAAETLTRAYVHWRKIGTQPWREGWVARVATNLALDAARKGNRISAEQPGEASSDDDDVAIRLALAEALARLPRRQREAVALRHLAGLSEQQVADALQVSAGSVKTHLHRGLAALRGRLADPDLFEPAGAVDG
jgi:RNA polymerase sigma factor (sigma-70 family)